MSRFAEVLSRLLSDALATMNAAVAMTADKGPAVAIEYIADYLNNTDAVDEDNARLCPEDWLTRWAVSRNGGPDPADESPGTPQASSEGRKGGS